MTVIVNGGTGYRGGDAGPGPGRSPFHADVAKLAASYDVDAIVTLGDLQPSWLESLDKCCQPKIGVYGNHDDEPYMTYFGIDNLHLNQLDLGALTFAGFEGCVSDKRSGIGRVGPSYTQRQAKKLVRKLPAADVLVCHCPPRGVNDDADDPAHIGYEGLRAWVDEYHPKYLLHGHVHPRPGTLLDADRRHPRGLRERCEGARTHLVVARRKFVHAERARSRRGWVRW